MAENITISKNPVLNNSEDYSFLRAKGMEYIEALGNSLWTDYNIHDPGITLLELLCYAITDLGYRTSFDIKDLLVETPGIRSNHDKQAFFTAREILTVNPWTIEDYRKLLIDIDGVKNAWLFCKESACEDLIIYANCAKSMLQYSPPTEHPVIIKGFYDVLIEFEEESVGDLNSGKIKYNISFITDTLNVVYSEASIEMRLPAWHDLEMNKSLYKSFRSTDTVITGVTVKFISGNKSDNSNIPQNELARALRKPLYATIDVVYATDSADLSTTETLTLTDVPFTVLFNNDADRKKIQLSDLIIAIEDASASGILAKYLEKINKADEVMTEVQMVLHQHRNLCEDFCSVRGIEIEDMAICADIDLSPEADIEGVMARAYYLISQYFSPDIRFYSLKELLTAGISTEEIFEGPKLNNGFINNDELERTQLKEDLYTSDIINLLADIPGVISIRNLVIVRYDKEGNRVQSESWTMSVKANHQPRLYIEGSKFLLFKNGLPFLPDKLELSDSLQVIRGSNSSFQFSLIDNDLPVPEGTYHQLNNYQPVQYGLPLTYGLSKEGLPQNASDQRRAQAKQLKAFLLVFEQIMVNYLEQLNHVKDLFSLDKTISRTYFSRFLDEADIDGISDLYAQVDGVVFNQTILNDLTESRSVFLDRRNRFLDSLMARFAERFADYALMLYSYEKNKKLADEILINNKINFLKDLPFMTANRARALNYKAAGHVCDNENIAGLKMRIERLLGLKMAEDYFELYEERDVDNVSFEQRWRLVDDEGNIYISSSTRYTDPDLTQAESKAQKEIDEVLKYITTEASFEIKKEKKWVLNLKNASGETIATRKQSFATESAAIEARDEIIKYVKQLLLSNKIFIVEHLLLRPRNIPGTEIIKGDPLLNICIPGSCNLCGQEDPYSFRMTIVMNGEAGLSNSGIAFRRFAEETIRMEIPAHLANKICWVSNKQLAEFEKLYCAWLNELASEEQNPLKLHTKLTLLIDEFIKLKSVYPKASLHDCADGNDENRVYLDQTII